MNNTEYIQELTRWIAWLQNPTFKHSTLDSWQRTKLENTLKHALMEAVRPPENACSTEFKDGNNH